MGWSSDSWEEDPSGYLQDDEFDYDEYVTREHGSIWSLKKTMIAVVILLVCVAIFLLQIGW